MSDNSKPTQNPALSFELTDWLDTTQRLDGAATEGPWAVKAGEVVARGDESPWPLHIAYATATGDVSFQPEDAEFIAHARTALPQAVAALRAVSDLHQPRNRVTQSASGYLVDTPGPCKDCDWDWDCPTIAAIQDTLGET